MDTSWELFTRWALWPTALSAVLGFAAFAVVLGPAEWFCRRSNAPRGGLRTDLLFWAFTPLVGKAVTLAVVTGLVAALMALGGRELDITSTAGRGPVGRQPLWLQALEALVLADFIFYWVHRAFHSTSLWPAHAVHHSSERLDWLSSMRFHPINDVVSRVVQAVPLVLLGFAPVAVVCAIPVIVVFIVVTHADVPWTWGPLKHVLVSPVYHHWHHSSEPEAIDRNFAGVLVLWDRLFGTRYMPADRLPAVYGVVGEPVPGGFLGLLLYPFRAVFRLSGSASGTSPAGGTRTPRPAERARP
jgi:sterol desaturase/sphingolipid hydroxylase (fatty acid hydroxylase superfamily)